MDEPTPEWQVPSCDPRQWGHLRMGTGHLLAAPSAPTSHVGERWWWEAGIKEGAGSWHGAQRTPPRGRARAELARHLTTCSFLQSARGGDRAGGAGHEGRTANGKW